MKPERPYVAIACGGTGGHLFPGIAVAEELLIRGCAVGLIISQKEIDQQIAASVRGAQILTISGKAFESNGRLQSLRAFLRSINECKEHFSKKPPTAVLAMGGFTSPPAVLAGRRYKAFTFLHEANAIPGRSNRWLAHFVEAAFVYFHEASSSLSHSCIHTIGMPVRNQFEEASKDACRMALGLDPKKPVLLIMGGSQGASGVNDLVIKSLSVLSEKFPDLQFFHLTGNSDVAKVKSSYSGFPIKAIVKSFFTEMELALGAASLAISRAGASSLAEFAAVGVPTIAIPYPHAAENHQFYNALHFQEAGAAFVLQQNGATTEQMVEVVARVIDNQEVMKAAMLKLHRPNAAADISDYILQKISCDAHGRKLPSSGRTTEASEFVELRQACP